MIPEFKPWPKIGRLHRDIIITEKIDGTNGCIVVTEEGDVYGQSRNRLLVKPGDDSFGFMAWIHRHADTLAKTLGPGYHYGEWCGKGIQRGYGLDEKWFALFDVSVPDIQLVDARMEGINICKVPKMWEGHATNLNVAVECCLEYLRSQGSMLWASEGFDRPEGIVIYHRQANVGFKVTLDNDGVPKGQA